MYERNPTLPFDALIPAILDSSSEYARDTIFRAVEARQITRLRLTASQDKQRLFYDARHRDAHFNPGDMVLLWTPSRRVGLREKLISAYFGPYRVLRQVTNITYEITPLDSTTSQLSTDVVHVTHLKRYNSDDLVSTGTVPSPPGVMLPSAARDKAEDSTEDDDARIGFPSCMFCTPMGTL